MLDIPNGLVHLFDAVLINHDVALNMRGHYKKWLHYYWNFCHQYEPEPDDWQSFPAFNDNLQAKRQSKWL